MNDQDPDDLFDALRRAWADSRPKPPASLWNRVQAQIPSSAVQPRLRRRKRQAGWLLSLLLLLLSGLSWHYWPTPGARLREPHPRSSAGQAPRAGSEQIPVERNGAVLSQRDTTHYLTNRPVLASPAPAVPERAVSDHGRGSYSPALATPASDISEQAGSGHARGVRPPLATTSLVTDSSNATRVSQREKAVVARSLMATTRSSSAKWLAAHPRMPAGTVLPGSRARRLRKGAVYAQLPASRTSPARTRKNKTESPHPEEGSASRELQAARNQPVHNPAGLATRTRQLPDTAISSSPGGLENAAALAAGREAAGLAPKRRPTLLGPGTTVTDSLTLRRVAVAATMPALPDPHQRADTSIAKPVVPLLRRWSVQVLAGPTRSYRRLGDEGFTLWGPTASLPPFPIRLGTGAAAANRRAEYEKPGTGWSLQFQAQRVLTGRWSVSVGVGYQEYALESLYPVYPIIITPGGRPAPPYSSRDTYRFVSVPVRMSYTLGYAGPFRYGLLAGPDLSLYVGGTSAGTGLIPQDWETSGSPYRPLQVALVAGLDLRYQLGPGLQGVVQPNVTTYLTSLSNPETGLAPRYLQGMGLLVGLSYGLPTRP